jgi:uncharacterized protein YggT (Ycf19 family)
VDSTTRLRRTTVVVAKVVTTLLYAYVIVVEVMLALAFVLRLFGADPSAGFTQFVYRSLERAMAPFRGIFPPVVLGTNDNQVDAVLDTSILFAMLVYALLLLAVGALVDWLTRRITTLDVRLADEAEQARRDAFVQERMFERSSAPQVIVTTSPPPPTGPGSATGTGGPPS